ncbi:N-acyl-aromatic-L-amino acid amidohydrolase (carboxylate-forming) isoform X1 [Aotus nancymaae]|uniref:N-acyl-aromatic-L-amino acid amidohydrolase (carboxylate-forming) isoform X1 n=2 Tax=Aotus nancymaae TaxID=37293 RepID=UPI0030FEA421
MVLRQCGCSEGMRGSSRPTPDDPYEVMRARELNQLLGPKASGRAFDFVLDLHNTTANMGTCLIAGSSHDVFALHLCRHLQVASAEHTIPRGEREGGQGGARPEPPLISPRAEFPWVPVSGVCHPPALQAPGTASPALPEGRGRPGQGGWRPVLPPCHALHLFPLPFRPGPLTCLSRPQLQYPELSCQVFLYQRSGEESYNLDSVAKNGLALELGPQPQGVLRADIFSRMRALVATVLDFIELFNQGTAFPAFELEAYRPVGVVDFPRTEAGNLAGTVHPQLQDQDFQPLQPGDPIFQMFSGEDLLYEGESMVYPVFINEAAYYEKGVAFVQTEKLTFSVPAMPALTPAPSPAS